MRSLNNVLAATDFSGSSRHAADRAARVARETGARLQLLHVVSGSALVGLQQLLGLGDPVEQSLVEETELALETLARELTLGRQVAVESKLVRGSVPTEIGRQADAFDADLVVLGARGAGFARRLLPGSTAERLLHKTLRPLLVVRQKAHEPYRRVLVPVDFSPWSAASLDLARRVAPGAHLVLLHSWELPFEGKLRVAGVEGAMIERYRWQTGRSASAQLHALAAAAGLSPADWTPCILNGDPALHIVEQEEAQDCDLVVMGKHGQNMLEELLLGSVTRQVLSGCAGDVLVSTLTTARSRPDESN